MRSQAKRARLYVASALAGGALLGTAGDAASWSNIVAPVRLSAGYLGSRASDYRENGGQVELAVRF